MLPHLLRERLCFRLLGSRALKMNCCSSSAIGENSCDRPSTLKYESSRTNANHQNGNEPQLIPKSIMECSEINQLDSEAIPHPTADLELAS